MPDARRVYQIVAGPNRACAVKASPAPDAQTPITNVAQLWWEALGKSSSPYKISRCGGFVRLAAGEGPCKVWSLRQVGTTKPRGKKFV